MVTHRRKSSGLYRWSWISLPTPFTRAQQLSELPLVCVTVCHHISTGLYHSLSAQRLSERTVYGYPPSVTCDIMDAAIKLQPSISKWFEGITYNFLCSRTESFIGIIQSGQQSDSLSCLLSQSQARQNYQC